MIIPVRCFSCGKPIAQHWEEFKEGVSENVDKKKLLDKLGIERYCCRQMFMGHVDLIDVTAKFKKA